MTVLTRYPTTSSQNGVWALTPSSGSSLEAILADSSDATYIATLFRALTDTQYAIFDIADIDSGDIPDGYKIRSVTLKARCFQVALSVGSSFLSDIIQIYGEVVDLIDAPVNADLGDAVSDVFRWIFYFLFPTPPAGNSPAWQDITVRTWLERPSGGEWTLDALNAATWRLGRQDLSGLQCKLSKAWIAVEINARPEVEIVPFDDDTVTTTTRPLLSFTYSDEEGDPKDAHRGKVFTADTVALPGFNVETSTPVAATVGTDGWVSGQGGQWLISPDLQNGDYVVYVQVRQAWTGVGQHPSLWASYAFTIDVPCPSPPVITPTVNTSGNFVFLDLTPGLVDVDNPLPETYNVYGSDDGGLTWALTWDGWQIQADADGRASTIDYLAPLHRGRVYKALAYWTYNGVKVASPPSEFVTVVPSADGQWLKDPLAPSLNTRILILDDSASQTRQQGQFVPLSDDLDATVYVIVTNGPLQGIVGEFVLGFKGPDDTSGWTRFGQIFRPGRTLLLQFSTGEQHWVRLGKEIKWDWRPRGIQTWWRKATLNYYEVAPATNPANPT